MSQKIGILGSGIVSQVLADGFIRHGYEVMRGSRSPQKLEEWKLKAGKAAHTGDFKETARFGDILVLAVAGGVASEVLKQCGQENLAGKTIIDPTNPIAQAPPVNGVLQFFTGMNDSLMERLQKQVPTGRFVKAFNCVGNAFMVNPDFGGQTPSMFICGNDEAAKKEVSEILDKFGWEIEDLGKVEAARAIEPLCILWCIPGFLYGRWSHVYKVLRK